jgi:hypothetical protein
VPRPVAESRRWGCGVYEFVEGSAVPSAHVGVSDVDQAVAFLATLKEISRRQGSENLAAASEACFTIRGIVQSIERRLDRLVRGPGSDPGYPALAEFLKTDFIPAFQGVIAWCHERLRTAGLSPERELSGAERTLSPSDFGYHNALRRSDGRLVFLDFEYFGWDDPAKMVADFLLHPAMELALDLRRQFVRGILEHFPDGSTLRERLRTVFPLFGLKWCTILLNEFLPEHLARRGFASAAAVTQADVQARQLAKAQRMLERVMSEYEDFPYDS